MATKYSIQKKWIANFSKSPLVNKDTGYFRKDYAHQLFYGREDSDYPESYPQNYRGFYESNYAIERVEGIETVLRFLHFIGIKLKREDVDAHLMVAADDYHLLLKKTYFLLRTLAHHREDLTLGNPFSENYRDIDFLIRIETGENQLTIFETELPELYNRYVTIPEGYENDLIAKELFNQIESSNQSFFITGKAGTGKSTFVHFFTRNTKKQVLLTAFTGIAAINVGGVTLHSFFKFPFRGLLPGDEAITVFKEFDKKRKVIEEIDTIIIDEVSMLRADILQAIDHSLRMNGGDLNSPFGGKQIIFVGDLFQLPPVTKESNGFERVLFNEIFKSPYFFDCDAYRTLEAKFFEFQIPQRQKKDLEFVELLDKVRDCTIDQESLDKLNERYDPFYTPRAEDFFITLTTSNYIADRENEKRLLAIQFMEYKFEADLKGDFDEERLPANSVLRLKKGAQVIFIKNDLGGERRWVNGTIGKIEFVADDIIIVKLPDGTEHKIEKETWEHRGYHYDKEKKRVTSQAKGTFTQYPIKLAWAITIHKSQGLTFDKVIIDLGSGAFVNGQLYTALSRCRTLDGIVLKRKIKIEDIIQDQRLIEFYEWCRAR